MDRTLSSFAILVPFLLFSYDLRACHGARVSPAMPTSTKFIRASCSATDYPALCFSTLSSYASTIQTSPAQLANTALLVSLSGARSTSTLMARMKVSGGMNPQVAAAVSDCMEMISDSVNELQDSMGEMAHLGGQNMAFQINNIQTWVSAALTNDDACMDGFSSSTMNGEVKNAVRGHVVNVAQMTSNALAFINSLVHTP